MIGLMNSLMLLGGGFLLVIVTAEILLRLFSDWKPRTIDPWAYRPSDEPGLHFEYEPDHRFANHYPARIAGGRPRSQEYEINSLGLRGPHISTTPAEGTLRIICIGDSCTFGEGVEESETYPSQLELLLNEDPGGSAVHSFEVINAGVAGYDIEQKLALFKKRGIRLQPDILMVGFTLNDPQLWPDPFINEKGFLSCRGLTRWKRLREEFKNRCALAMWGAHLWSKVFGAVRLLASYHPSSQGWVRARSAVRQFKTLAYEHDVRFLVLIMPMLFRLDDAHPYTPIYRIMEEFFESEGIPYLNLLPSVKGRKSRRMIVKSCDFHPGPEAYRAYAGGIHRALTSGSRFQNWLIPKRMDADDGRDADTCEVNPSG